MNPDTVMSAMPGAGAGAAAAEEEAAKPAAEEKTAFNVKVTKFDAKAKIKVIKEVRDIAKLGLKEVRSRVQSVPVCAPLTPLPVPCPRRRTLWRGCPAC